MPCFITCIHIKAQRTDEEKQKQRTVQAKRYVHIMEKNDIYPICLKYVTLIKCFKSRFF